MELNRKIMFVVLCIVLAAVIAGAAAFYNKFSQEYAGNNSINVIEKNDTAETDTKQHQSNEAPAEESDRVQAEDEQQTQQSQQSENMAPDVEFFDSDGNSVMLSDFFDKPVVFNFWATWCGPCKSEMPGFNRLYGEYKDRVNFVMLNVSDSQDVVAEFLEENAYAFPVYFDKTQIAAYTYGANSIPLTFVLYKGGEVYGYQIGVLPEEALEQAIKTVLGEE